MVLAKNDSIEQNWDLFENKTKISTYLKKLDENWEQKGILTFFYYVLLLTI